jgi:uncharacterized membrane protein
MPRAAPKWIVRCGCAILINVALAFVFGASLLPGRDPFISRFARMEHGTLPADLDRYTRRLTWIWTVLFAAMATIALALSLFGSLAAWSTFTNLVAYALVAALFVGKYAYRRLRYRNYRHATLLDLVANVRSAGLFPRK